MIPTACEAPEIQIIGQHTPNKRTPAGNKSMAEGGAMGAIGAVNNAVKKFYGSPFKIFMEWLITTMTQMERRQRVKNIWTLS